MVSTLWGADQCGSHSQMRSLATEAHLLSNSTDVLRQAQ